MKRYAFLGLLALAVVAMIIASCGGPKKAIEEAPPPSTKPVETPQPHDTTTPPPPAAPKLQESQLQTVYFDFDKYNLRPDAKASLDADYQLLTQFQDAIVKIEGHCDERGTVEYNMSLGEKRARAVMDYLVGRGIPANRLSIISYGKERPVAMGHDEVSWQKNRRGEFRIISQ